MVSAMRKQIILHVEPGMHSRLKIEARQNQRTIGKQAETILIAAAGKQDSKRRDAK
jgi:hypothetical protein